MGPCACIEGRRSGRIGGLVSRRDPEPATRPTMLPTWLIIASVVAGSLVVLLVTLAVCACCCFVGAFLLNMDDTRRTAELDSAEVDDDDSTGPEHVEQSSVHSPVPSSTSSPLTGPDKQFRF